MCALVTVTLMLLSGPEKPAKQLPELSFKFFNPQNGTTIEPTNGWIIARRDEYINFHVMLEVESVEAPYDSLIIRDSSGPDPLTVGSKQPQNLWLTASRIEPDGNHTPTSILIHCSGGGKDLRTYSAMISLRILFPEPERSKRTEAAIDRIFESLKRTKNGDSESLEKKREMFRRRLYQEGVDMPPGDYLLEAVYSPIADGKWKGKLVATANVRITNDNDPLTKPIPPP
ncbi:MAG: hypothetical protein HY287_16000 [Planctomycetes bacterium]|nr:hypothetical protein [Planctomycetota bacterium]